MGVYCGIGGLYRALGNDVVWEQANQRKRLVLWQGWYLCVEFKSNQKQKKNQHPSLPSPPLPCITPFTTPSVSILPPKERSRTKTDKHDVCGGRAMEEDVFGGSDVVIILFVF